MLSSSRNRHVDATTGVQKVSDFLSPEPLHADATSYALQHASNATGPQPQQPENPLR
jgi:hypothetical protein